MSAETIKSARRVFEILEFFERERRPLSLKEICERLAYPASSGSVLLKSIVALGYLDYDRARKTYFPTMRITALGAWAPGALFGEGGVAQLMDHLHRATGETVILAAQSDLHAQYVHLIHSAEPLQVAVPPGARRPLERSGMGWVLLGANPDAEIDKLRRRINAQPGRTEPRLTQKALMEKVNEARERGYAFSRHTVSEGAGIIAALLPRKPDARVFAIGVAGPVARLEPKEDMIVREIRAGIARLAA
ncbi:MAG TPA: IclR family transcriptional regulator [Caulobacteraceae bacterium]|nr:IclR family transcriptional regulator [Caulobacteraceae bacterium]